MQINLLPQNPNFKQIKLSEEEMIKAKGKYQYMLTEPENAIHNYKMFDLFESHLNNEVNLKQYKTGKERRFFSTNLYIKFFEILNSTKNRELPFESFIDNLNNYINLFTIRKIADKDSPNLSDYNVSSAKKSAYNIYKNLNMTKEEFLDFNQKVPLLQNTSGYLLKQDINNVVKNLDFEENECIELYKRNPQALLRPSDWIINNAKNTKKILNINNPEDFKKLIKNNAQLLTFEELETSIKNIANFLNTTENNVKKMIKSQPPLATMKFEHIENNFYTMQDYLNVNDDKMSEIAVIAPIIIKDMPIININRYKKISETLNILPETFINKANTLPAIYRVTESKLNKYIDFISKKLNYSRKESIEYISKNLNILSYNYNNMITRSEKNYEVLNKELGIDYKTYLYFLEKNAWILGQKEETLIDNIKLIKDYFNVDEKTRLKMIRRNPQLLTYSEENMDKDITESSKLLKISKEDFKYLCIIEAKLATRGARYHEVDVPLSAKLLNMSEEDFIEFGKINPTLLAISHNKVKEIKEREDFSNLIFEKNEIDLTNPVINYEDTFLEKALTLALLGTLGLSFNYKNLNIAEYISKCKKTIEIKIPQHNLSEKFVDYAKVFIKNNNLESKCKVLIKK